VNLPCNDELSTSSLLLWVYRSIQNADLCSWKQNLGLCIISDWVQGLVLIFGMGQRDGPSSIRYEAIKTPRGEILSFKEVVIQNVHLRKLSSVNVHLYASSVYAHIRKHAYAETIFCE